MRHLQPLHTPATHDRSLVMSSKAVRVPSSALLLPLSKLTTRNEGWSPTYHQRLVDATLRLPATKLPAAHSWRPFTWGPCISHSSRPCGTCIEWRAKDLMGVGDATCGSRSGWSRWSRGWRAREGRSFGDRTHTDRPQGSLSWAAERRE